MKAATIQTRALSNILRVHVITTYEENSAKRYQNLLQYILQTFILAVRFKFSAAPFFSISWLSKGRRVKRPSSHESNHNLELATAKLGLGWRFHGPVYVLKQS